MARFQFPEWTEGFTKKWLLLLVGGAPIYLIGLAAFGLNATAIRVGYRPEQPIPYSHATHVGELGLDCRYCHNTVDVSPHSAVPPVATCMNCHTGIHAQSEALLPVREAYAGGEAIEWVRVHDLPDYVYFNHSAHVTRGVGCESCHGRIDQMAVVAQVEELTMSWCLDCHRDPWPNLRPLSEITTMGYEPSGDRHELGRQIAEERNLKPSTDCSTCHR